MRPAPQAHRSLSPNFILLPTLYSTRNDKKKKKLSLVSGRINIVTGGCGLLPSTYLCPCKNKQKKQNKTQLKTKFVTGQLNV